MASQKLENLLNLSLEAAPQQREQSLELPVGVVEDRWELIIKYHGDLREALRRAGFPALLRTEYLLPGYAIMGMQAYGCPGDQPAFHNTVLFIHIHLCGYLFFTALKILNNSFFHLVKIKNHLYPPHTLPGILPFFLRFFCTVPYIPS